MKLTPQVCKVSFLNIYNMLKTLQSFNEYNIFNSIVWCVIHFFNDLIIYDHSIYWKDFLFGIRAYPHLWKLKNMKEKYPECPPGNL